MEDEDRLLFAQRLRQPLFQLLRLGERDVPVVKRPAVSRLTGLPVFMTCCAEALYPELAGTIDRLFPLKLQKLYYQLTQEVSYGKTNISGRAL